MAETFISAYSQGKKAFKDGLSIDDNPYNKPPENDLLEWVQHENKNWWKSGFQDAEVNDIFKKANAVYTRE